MTDIENPEQVEALDTVAEILTPVLGAMTGTWELRHDVLKGLFDRSLAEMERLLALAEEKAVAGNVDEARVLAEIADRWRNVLYI